MHRRPIVLPEDAVDSSRWCGSLTVPGISEIYLCVCLYVPFRLSDNTDSAQDDNDVICYYSYMVSFADAMLKGNGS